MLKVEGLRAGYGSLEVLHDLRFEVPQGQIVAILGANGAGKSTIMRALSGLIRAKAGTITLAGKRIERLPADQRVPQGLALVPEGRELFSSLTVRENLIMGAYTRHAGKEVEADIERMLDYFPRLRQRIDAHAASLSGGEGQMLAISRALMSHPQVLLLDEPSHGLAPSIVDQVFDVITRLNREAGMTILLVEQNARKALSAASMAYVLQNGSIALSGSTAELAQTTAVHELYLGGRASTTPIASGGAIPMATPTYLPGVTVRTVATPRLNTSYFAKGSESDIPVIFIHGNVSSSRFYEETLAALPEGFYGIAPDLRGFGGSETKAIDATRGLRDFSDDLHAFVEALGLAKVKSGGLGGLFGGTKSRKIHFVGWSMGAGVTMQYAIDHPDLVASLTLISPLSPYGFGGTKDVNGTFTYPDLAGAGGGTANPDFVKLLGENDRGAESPNSPRNVMNTFYFKPPFKAAPDREEAFVDSMLTTRTGEGNYPGDMTPSGNWPNVAPGKRGVNNTMAPNYCNLSSFARLAQHPPVLWVRGADDQIVSDNSFFDLGTLGKLGFVPGWPGDETYPPQPMVSQMRAVLDTYRANGGTYEELVLSDCGHSPLIEKPAEFRQALFALLARG